MPFLFDRYRSIPYFYNCSTDFSFFELKRSAFFLVCLLWVINIGVAGLFIVGLVATILMYLHNIYTHGLKHQIGKLIKVITNRRKKRNGDLIYDQPRPAIYSNVMLMLTYFITIQAKKSNQGRRQGFRILGLRRRKFKLYNLYLFFKLFT